MMDSHCTLSLSSLDCDDFVSTVITVYTAIAVSIIICCDDEHELKP